MQSKGKILNLIITIIFLKHENCKKTVNPVEVSIVVS